MTRTVSRRSLIQAAALLPALTLLPAWALAAPTRGFTHSVASGDPQQGAGRGCREYDDAGRRGHRSGLQSR